MHRVLPYPVIRCQKRHTACLYYHREHTCSSSWCTHTCIDMYMYTVAAARHGIIPVTCTSLCNYHGLLCYFYPDKECVLIQTVARANSFFMTLPLRRVNRVADSVQDMDHNAIHDKCLGPKVFLPVKGLLHS